MLHGILRLCNPSRINVQILELERLFSKVCEICNAEWCCCSEESHCAEFIGAVHEDSIIINEENWQSFALFPSGINHEIVNSLYHIHRSTVSGQNLPEMLLNLSKTVSLQVTVKQELRNYQSESSIILHLDMTVPIPHLHRVLNLRWCCTCTM